MPKKKQLTLSTRQEHYFVTTGNVVISLGILNMKFLN